LAWALEANCLVQDHTTRAIGEKKDALRRPAITADDVTMDQILIGNEVVVGTLLHGFPCRGT